MKFYLSILYLIFLIAGCSTTTKNYDDSTKTDEELEEEFANVENSDFIPAKTVRYKRGRDLFEGKIFEQDAFAGESINRFSKQELMEVSSMDDPIAKGVSLCYNGMFAEGFKVFDISFNRFKKHPHY